MRLTAHQLYLSVEMTCRTLLLSYIKMADTTLSFTIPLAIKNGSPWILMRLKEVEIITDI